MGGTFSSIPTTPTNLNDSPSDSVNPNMSSSSGSKTPESDPQTQPSKSTIDPKTLDEDSESNNVVGKGGEEGEEEEEEGECGFCVFMKGGGCRDIFIAWENCIEVADKNKEVVREKCFEVTVELKNCMEAHADYYGLILQAEKAGKKEVAAVAEKRSEQNADQEAAVGSKDSESSEKKEG